MGTPFISLLEPTRLDAYDGALPPSAQRAAGAAGGAIPPVFVDAMAAREAVFVREQGIPLAHEFDEDDARSCHWVAYASVNIRAPRPPPTGDRPPQQEEKAGSGGGRGVGGGEDTEGPPPLPSGTRSVPIGTLRIVPFPHPPHPPDGARYVDNVLLPADSTTTTTSSSPSSSTTTIHPSTSPSPCTSSSPTQQQPQAQSQAQIQAQAQVQAQISAQLSAVEQRERQLAALPFGRADRATTYHDGREPYVKLSRVAVVPEFRGLGIATQLWAAARRWLEAHPAYFDPSVAGLGMDQLGAGAGAAAADIPRWNGLVCCHAQESVVGVYERWGFRVDEGMGKWYEEGIPHVGMFARLHIKGSDPKV
ncbi:hypothetical protein F4809DRAFT_610394 [Biscogniauxia mediterranea]|nr:hypothetical protein F4809DRAFT_610394 [Biscogniauxia mediterranea]